MIDKQDTMKCYFPAEVCIEVFITDGQGSNGKATIGMGVGLSPSAIDIEKRIKKFEKEELPEMNGDYRLMTRREMLSYRIYEETGQRAFVACSKEFDILCPDQGSKNDR